VRTWRVFANPFTYSYWMDRLILRYFEQSLKYHAIYKGVGRVEDWRGRVEDWRGRVGGLTMLSDTGDQVVCTVGHSSPDHSTRRVVIEWNSLGPQATLLMYSSGPTGSELVLHGLIGSAKTICKSRPSYL